jgi:hypothetical protein
MQFNPQLLIRVMTDFPRPHLVLLVNFTQTKELEFVSYPLHSGDNLANHEHKSSIL